MGPQVEKNAAVEFVFMEPTFPRSVRFCVREVREELGQLGNNREALRSIERLRRQLRGFEAEALESAQLHDYIDELQLKIDGLHGAISESWFLSHG